LHSGLYSLVVFTTDQSGGIFVLGLNQIASDSLLSSITNMSVRGYTGSKTKSLIAGFTLNGTQKSSCKMTARGLGPSLNSPPYNITNAIKDPYIILSSPNVQITNDDWNQSQNSNILKKLNRNPSNRHESGLYFQGTPSTYTIILQDSQNLNGIGLIEVFKE
jgi:hypothetical protein